MTVRDVDTGRAAGRLALAGVLGAGYLWRCRGRHPTARPRSARRAGVASAALSIGVPAAVLARAALGCPDGCPRLTRPSGPLPLALLVIRLATGTITEELLWRAPVTLARHRWQRLLTAAASAAGFVAAHRRRDGPRVLLHLPSSLAWSSAAALDRRLRWPFLGHTLYNLGATLLVAGPTASSTANPAAGSDAPPPSGQAR